MSTQLDIAALRALLEEHGYLVGKPSYDERRGQIESAIFEAAPALIDAYDERARLRAVVDRCHEAIGESPASDDETLPDGIALHLREARAEVERLREALTWCSSHPYAGGKTFADTDIVRAALTPPSGEECQPC